MVIPLGLAPIVCRALLHPEHTMKFVVTSQALQYICACLDSLDTDSHQVSFSPPMLEPRVGRGGGQARLEAGQSLLDHFVKK